MRRGKEGQAGSLRWKHGRNCYTNHRCRCETCKTDNARYQREQYRLMARMRRVCVLLEEKICEWRATAVQRTRTVEQETWELRHADELAFILHASNEPAQSVGAVDPHVGSTGKLSTRDLKS